MQICSVSWRLEGTNVTKMILIEGRSCLHCRRHFAYRSTVARVAWKKFKRPFIRGPLLKLFWRWTSCPSHTKDKRKNLLLPRLHYDSNAPNLKSSSQDASGNLRPTTRYRRRMGKRENDLRMVDKSETKLPELSLWKSLCIRTTEARLIYTDNDWAEGKA